MGLANKQLVQAGEATRVILGARFANDEQALYNEINRVAFETDVGTLVLNMLATAAKQAFIDAGEALGRDPADLWRDFLRRHGPQSPAG